MTKLRREYTDAGLNEQDLDTNPFNQFEQWFQEAIDAKIDLPDAMTLATATKDGIPSARIVLLRGHDERGFVFYTDYESQKGKELAENPNAALVFYWRELDRQVRITGQVSKVSRENSHNYFQSRPVDSRLAALASKQSAVIPDRAVLEERFKQLAAQYQDKEIPLPSDWGGYRLSPNMIEFWSGRPSRLHDRLRYTRQPDDSWRIERISP
jgi:pyridoxamine 5'-phosphate oxidase